MQITNVRTGHACNSSSSHSLLYWPGVLPPARPAYGQEYGWDDFTLVGAHKLGYAAQQLYQTLRSMVGPEHAVLLVESLFEGTTALDPEGYVDHQSLWSFPKAWNEPGLDIEFIRHLLAFIKDPHSVILGGNDNSEGHALRDVTNGTEIRMPDGDSLVARFDRPYWVLFNQRTGTKLRLVFGPPPAEPYKAHWPELVDVKLTDNCPIGCAFCYQDSTPGRPGINMDRVRRLADVFLHWRVFEVALGGGEITLDRNFLYALEVFRAQGIVPNFTTRNLAWFHDETVRHRVFDVAGAVAVSVNDGQDVARLGAILTKYGIDPARVNVQYVMGTGVAQGTGFTSRFDWHFRGLLHAAKEARVRLTLLGYKHVGRGLKVTPADYAAWPALVQEQKGALPSLQIDTALAAETDLDALGIPKWSYHVLEGKTSMYVDLPNLKAGRSSYHELVDLGLEEKVLGSGLHEALESVWRSL